MNSWNTNFPTPDNGTQLLSFFEKGNVSVDFIHQRMRVDFYIDTTSGHISGSLFGFQSNKTMYILGSDGTCKSFPLAYDIPSGWPKNVSHYVGQTKIGKTRVAIFSIFPTPSGKTNQTVLYDIKHCAMVSTYLKNTNPYDIGYASGEYFDWKNHYTESFFILPSACYESVQQPKVSLKNSHQKKIDEEDKP
eukprot:gene8516-10469_t